MRSGWWRRVLESDKNDASMWLVLNIHVDISFNLESIRLVLNNRLHTTLEVIRNSSELWFGMKETKHYFLFSLLSLIPRTQAHRIYGNVFPKLCTRQSLSSVLALVEISEKVVRMSVRGNKASVSPLMHSLIFYVCHWLLVKFVPDMCAANFTLFLTSCCRIYR